MIRIANFVWPLLIMVGVGGEGQIRKFSSGKFFGIL